MTIEPLEALELFARQPNASSVVWQSNQLVVARHQATPMMQKLILYSIAMINANAITFSRYRIHVASYAKSCGIKANDVYRSLREAAEGLAVSPLVIKNHKAEDGKVVDLLTHWFSQVEFGAGYIDVTFPPALGQYLLHVRNEFLKFNLSIPLQFSGEYTIRLYQWAKRWQFATNKSLTIPELRSVLGLVELDAKGNAVRERLSAYGDLKKWALLTAVDEINRASDLSIGWRETKEPGSKRVATIVFTILENPQFKPAASPSRMAGVRRVVQAPVDPEMKKFLAQVQAEFGLSATQVRCQVAKHPLDYLKAKATIVRSKPRANAAQAFLAALRDDWQASKKTRPGKDSAASQPAPLAPEPSRAAPVEEQTAQGVKDDKEKPRPPEEVAASPARMHVVKKQVLGLRFEGRQRYLEAMAAQEAQEKRWREGHRS